MGLKMPELVLSRWSALRLQFSVLSFSFQSPFPAENLEAAIVRFVSSVWDRDQSESEH